VPTFPDENDYHSQLKLAVDSACRNVL